MGRYTFVVDINAPRDRVFDLWVDLDRAPEWIEGLSRITDVSGPTDQAGTSYVVHFGKWSTSTTTILEAERPRFIRSRFGNWLLRGEQSVQLEEIDSRTRLTQTFTTNGIIPAIVARIFASGSYKGSFRGELQTFKEMCEREAATKAEAVVA
jgi:uncharacterized protein YndB with AHSA1/START domain